MLTDADKMELRSKIMDIAAISPDAPERMKLAMNDILEEVSEFIERKIESLTGLKAYPVRFDVRWIECMRIMKNTGSPMTTNEIAEMMTGDRLYRKQVVRYFVYARHWKLINKTGEKYKGSDLYVLTPEAIACLDKDALTVQSTVWTKKGVRVNPPQGETDGAYIKVLPYAI